MREKRKLLAANVRSDSLFRQSQLGSITANLELIDQNLRFLRENQNQNFFLYLPYHAVHGPHVVPPENKQRWKEKLQGKNPGIDPDMLASLEFVDRSVGRVLDTLDKLGLADNTLVALAGDNGGEGRVAYCKGNKPFRAGKGTLYEGGVRVPLSIRWPKGIAPGKRCDVPVHFADFFPTFCDLAGVGIDPSHKLDGMSLKPLFSGRLLLKLGKLVAVGGVFVQPHFQALLVHQFLIDYVVERLLPVLGLVRMSLLVPESYICRGDGGAVDPG